MCDPQFPDNSFDEKPSPPAKKARRMTLAETREFLRLLGDQEAQATKKPRCEPLTLAFEILLPPESE